MSRQVVSMTTRSSIHPRWRVLLVFVLLAVIGLGGWLCLRWVQAELDLRAATEALDRRDLVTARARIEHCLRRRPTSALVHLLAARTARRGGDTVAAERYLTSAEQLGAAPEAIDLEKILTRAQVGDMAPVEQLLHNAVTQGHPESVLILEALAQGYLATFQMSAAVAALDRWLVLRPDQVQALLWRGLAYERLRRAQDALADYQRAYQVAPENQEAKLQLAELLIALHRPSEARQLFEQMLTTRHGTSAVQRGLATCLRELGDGVQAVHVLDALLVEDPSDYRALSERGKLALEAGKLAEAEPLLRQALAVAPYEYQTIYALVQCLQQRGQVDQAKEWLARHDRLKADFDRLAEVTRIIQERPHDPAPRCEAGGIFLRTGQGQEGERWLLSSLQQEPFYPPAHEALAEYYLRRGDVNRAERHRRQGQRVHTP